jgi:hypothetical protein
MTNILSFMPPLSISGAERRVKEQNSERRNRQTLTLLAARFILVPCLAYSSTVKMEAKCSSENSALTGLHDFLSYT